MSQEREELIAQANELSLEFRSNISDEKLKKLIADAQAPATKPEPKKEKGPVQADDKMSRRRKYIADARRKAMKLSVVTITNRDKRENDVVTTAPLSVENQFFSVAKDVPLDIPVELEQCLIDLADSAMITLHKDEIVNGKRTGNKVSVSVKRYSVSYGRQD